MGKNVVKYRKKYEKTMEQLEKLGLLKHVQHR